MSRAATAVLSTENLLHNVQVIRAKTNPAKMIAMVKANAYGHGIRSVARKLENYIDMFGVASIDEGIILREIGIKTPILLAEGIFEKNELLIACAENFHIVFHNAEQLKWLDESALPQPINAWIKINTGMCRLGFSIAKAEIAYKQLSSNAQVKSIVPIMSHLACSDMPDHPLNAMQISCFEMFAAVVKSEYSLCASAGIINFPNHYYHYVRPGLSLYGISPINGTTGADFFLKPVMTLQSKIIAINDLTRGDCIGYGARYCCAENSRIGIVALGYGDGYPVSARDGTPVLVNGSFCPLVGRVSMDMLAIDITSCPTVKVGDTVTLWGEGLPIEKVAEHTSAITWQMITAVQNRVKFLWI